jgi:hypothetical protein
MSKNCSDFVGELVPIKQTILGIGKSTAIMQGTLLKWTFEDDKGKVHTFLLPGSLYTLNIPDYCCRNIGHNIIATGMPTVIPPTLTGFFFYGTALPE